MKCKNCGHGIEPNHYSTHPDGTPRQYYHICACKNSHNFHTVCDVCDCANPEPEGDKQ